MYLGASKTNSTDICSLQTCLQQKSKINLQMTCHLNAFLQTHLYCWAKGRGIEDQFWNQKLFAAKDEMQMYWRTLCKMLLLEYYLQSLSAEERQFAWYLQMFLQMWTNWRHNAHTISRDRLFGWLNYIF